MKTKNKNEFDIDRNLIIINEMTSNTVNYLLLNWEYKQNEIKFFVAKEENGA